MRLLDYIKKLIKDYFIIFALIVILTTLLRQFLAPSDLIELNDIYMFMVCAFISVLPSFIFYSNKELSKKEMNYRMVIHFIVLEISIIIIATLLGWISSIVDTLSVSLQIAVVYVLFRLFSWIIEKKEADRINEKLNDMKDTF